MVEPGSELDAGLGLDALFTEGMAQQLHLGHQVGALQQAGGGSAAGERHMGERRSQRKALQHLLELEVAELERHIHFIEHHELAIGSGEVIEGALPGLLHQLAIALTVLGFPGEALAEGMPMQGLAKQLEGLGLARLPATLDELHHRHLLAMAEGAQHQPQGCGGLALAIAGEHQHQTLLEIALPHPLALHLLTALHAAAEPRRQELIRRINLAPGGTADFVLTFRNLHNWLERGEAEAALRAFRLALKPGGVLGVVDHRGRNDLSQEAQMKSGYVREDFAIALIERAGFRLGGRSEINANPLDSKDHPEGGWTLPPTFRMGDRDRARYAAVGESDRFTLKFVKV